MSRPIPISPFNNGITARRAVIASLKLKCPYGAIHVTSNGLYHPCSSPVDFKRRFKRYVLKDKDIKTEPYIIMNTDGEYIIKNVDLMYNQKNV